MSSVIAPPYPADLWKVARVDVHHGGVSAERRAELFAWLELLGVPYMQCIPHLVITQDRQTRGLLLHLSRQARDTAGRIYIDHAADRVHTEPVVLTIDDYPAWLVEVSQQQANETEEGSHGRARTDE